jgi:hypothetical protein
VISTAAKAQILNQYLPSPNLGYGADYLRRGSGYGGAANNPNQDALAPDVTVTTRAHPEYDPVGVRYGNWQFGATAGENIGFDSNPLGQSHAKSSGFNNTQANVSAEGVYDRFGVNANLGVDSFQYWSIPAMNHTDGNAYLGGYYDIGPRDRLQASYTYLHSNVLPTGIDTVGTGFVGNVQNGAVPYNVNDFRVSYTTQVGRFTIIPDAGYTTYRFGSDTNPANNLTINDRNVAQIGTTGKYELSPGRDLVVVVRGANAGFQNNPIGVPGQNYNDYQFMAGIDFQTRGKLRFKGLVGYETRQYTASGAGSATNSPVFAGEVIWNATGVTTVTLDANRQIADAVAGGSTTFTYTTVRAQVDHEVRRNIILTGYAQIQWADYANQGNATLYDFGAKATYKMNRHVALFTSAEYINRAGSGTPGGLNSYTDFIGLVGVKFFM